MALRAQANATGRVRTGGRGGGGLIPFDLLPGPVVAGTTFDPAGANTLSNGNLTVAGASGESTINRALLAVTSGKYCARFICNTLPAITAPIGIVDSTDNLAVSSGFGLANRATGVGIQPGDGNVYGGTSFTVIGNLGASYTTGDEIMFCLDMTAKRLWVRKNNTGNWNNSGTADPATGVGGLVLPAGITSARLAAIVPGAVITIDPNPSNKPSGFSGWTSLQTVPIDVAIFMGQSNATGQQSDTSLSWRSDPNILAWNGTALAQYVPNTFTGLEWGSSTGRWAAEAEYARLYRAANPTKKLVIIKYAASGSMLYQTADGQTTYDWNTASTSELFANAGFNVNNAITALTAAGYVPTIRLLDWNQWEADATVAAQYNAYETNLTNLVAGFRNASGSYKLPASAKIAIGRARTGFAVGAPTIRTAQANVAAADVGGPQWIYDQDDLPLEADNTHYTNAGQTTRGARLWAVDQGTYTQP